MTLFSYSFRNLWTRRLTTALTAGGMALVVFVFAAILMLAEGLQQTLVETGSPENVVVIRKGSGSEVMSGLDRGPAAVVETLPEIARDGKGDLLLAKEVVVLVSLPRRDTKEMSHVTVRGVGAQSPALRPQVRLVAGRMPRRGSLEMAAGKSIARRFQGGGLGETLCCAMRDWRIVGIFDAGGTGFDSEVWADADQVMQAFRRPVYSSVTFRLREPSAFAAVRPKIEGDPRLALDAKRETRYYAEQSEMMAKLLRILGYALTAVFSLGAVIGAMITMYAAVAHRTAEIGTLRALGFSRRSILGAFLLESLLLGFAGGAAGLLGSSFLRFLTVSTLNFQTFSELAFRLTLSSDIVFKAFAFALGMGLVGGILPAFRASRMKIVEALRAS